MRDLNPFETYLVHEFVEDYEDGLLSRRDMVGRVAHIAGGVASAAALLAALGVAPLAAGAQSATPPPMPTATGPRSPLSVAADDPRVAGEAITFPGPGGATLMAYQARPAAGAATPGAGGRLPVVLVCHENRGLTDHIRDVARRWAVLGYVACAVDLLSREGGTAAVADPSRIPAILTADENRATHVPDFRAAAAHYGAQAFADASRLAMQGFCFGGGVTWLAAEQMPELRATAAFYGPPPPLDHVADIKAAVLGVYSDDPKDFANGGREELAAALQAAGVVHEMKVYPGTQHAFHNDTGARWNETQALAAWNDTVAWFAAHAGA